MDIIKLIIIREYWTRVRRKSFFVITLLGPLVFGLVMILPAYLAKNKIGADVKNIEIVDESKLFKTTFKNEPDVHFHYKSDVRDKAIENYLKGDNDALLYIPVVELKKPKGIILYSKETLSPKLIKELESKVEKTITNYKLLEAGVTDNFINELKSTIDIQTMNLSESGESESNVEIATGIALSAGMLIYFFIFYFGVQVMRGVMEEKTNRIVEVIISSVKPFQLMMGKIVGVALVAFTQVILWVVLAIGIGVVFGGMNSSSVVAKTQQVEQAEVSSEMLTKTMDYLFSTDMVLLVVVFLFFFIGGYFIYATLFAAIGSLMDNDTDSQQFMLPVTLPLVLSIVFIGSVVESPNGDIAFWMSLFPFTSPIVMMVRYPFIGFGWEVVLSMIILILSFLAMTWLSARIYRVGIFMYGKKVTYKEISKWLFYKM